MYKYVSLSFALLMSFQAHALTGTEELYSKNQIIGAKRTAQLVTQVSNECDGGCFPIRMASAVRISDLKNGRNAVELKLAQGESFMAIAPDKNLVLVQTKEGSGELRRLSAQGAVAVRSIAFDLDSATMTTDGLFMIRFESNRIDGDDQLVMTIEDTETGKSRLTVDTTTAEKMGVSPFTFSDLQAAHHLIAYTKATGKKKAVCLSNIMVDETCFGLK